MSVLAFGGNSYLKLQQGDEVLFQAVTLNVLMRRHMWAFLGNFVFTFLFILEDSNLNDKLFQMLQLSKLESFS